MHPVAPRQIAVFVNVDSLAGRHGADLHAADILAELRRFGAVQAAFAYGDWVRQRRLQQEFDAAAFRLIAVPRPPHVAADADETDRQLVDQAFRISLDALEFALSHARIDTIAIAGTSPLYAQVSARLRAHGLNIIGIGPDDAACRPWVLACHRFALTTTMLGRRQPTATFEEGHLRLARLVASRPNTRFSADAPEVIHAALVEADPAFDPRNYGCEDFNTWFAKYHHLFERASRAAATTDRRSGVEDAGAPASASPGAGSVARAILMRALVDASFQGFPVSLARFRDTVQLVAPDFNETAFGFETFLACLEAFPDLVVVDRGAWEVYPNDGVIPLDPPRPGPRKERPITPAEDRRRTRREPEAAGPETRGEPP
jgi:hypothetical protein